MLISRFLLGACLSVSACPAFAATVLSGDATFIEADGGKALRIAYKADGAATIDDGTLLALTGLSVADPAPATGYSRNQGTLAIDGASVQVANEGDTAVILANDAGSATGKAQVGIDHGGLLSIDAGSGTASLHIADSSYGISAGLEVLDGSTLSLAGAASRIEMGGQGSSVSLADLTVDHSSLALRGTAGGAAISLGPSEFGRGSELNLSSARLDLEAAGSGDAIVSGYGAISATGSAIRLAADAGAARAYVRYGAAFALAGGSLSLSSESGEAALYGVRATAGAVIDIASHGDGDAVLALEDYRPQNGFVSSSSILALTDSALMVRSTGAGDALVRRSSASGTTEFGLTRSTMTIRASGSGNAALDLGTPYPEEDSVNDSAIDVIARSGSAGLVLHPRQVMSVFNGSRIALRGDGTLPAGVQSRPSDLSLLRFEASSLVLDGGYVSAMRTTIARNSRLVAGGGTIDGDLLVDQGTIDASSQTRVTRSLEFQRDNSLHLAAGADLGVALLDVIGDARLRAGMLSVVLEGRDDYRAGQVIHLIQAAQLLAYAGFTMALDDTVLAARGLAGSLSLTTTGLDLSITPLPAGFLLLAPALLGLAAMRRRA